MSNYGGEKSYPKDIPLCLTDLAVYVVSLQSWLLDLLLEIGLSRWLRRFDLWNVVSFGKCR